MSFSCILSCLVQTVCLGGQREIVCTCVVSGISITLKAVLGRQNEGRALNYDRVYNFPLKYMLN